jgi:hypothetical protein
MEAFSFLHTLVKWSGQVFAQCELAACHHLSI